MPARTLEQYQDEFKTLMQEVWTGIEKLGDKLVRARKDLSADDYDALCAWLGTWWTKADLKAAEAVGRGELDARLFPHGTRNSKVMSLTREDQQRLLSSERFSVYDNFGRVVQKTWAEMSTDMRNRLLGDKGGSIHSLSKQRKPGARKERVLVFEAARYYAGDLLFNGGATQGKISIGALVQAMPEDELEALVAKIAEIQTADEA
ncbi:MAG TPA: hypothetical protein VGR71_16230 [Nitrospira sp.]|nr:hypothetical protein [Nitrospira sp.]